MMTIPAPFTARCWRCGYEIEDVGTVWERQLYQNGDIPCPRCGRREGFEVIEDYSAALDVFADPTETTTELAKVMVSDEDSTRGATVRRGPRQRVSLAQARETGIAVRRGEYDIYVNGRQVQYWSEAGRMFRQVAA